MSTFNKARQAKEEVEVNLIPVMNLFVTLIPFLLLAAAFYHVGVIPTSLPSQTDGNSDIEADTESVTVNLQIQDDQLQLSATNSVIEQETLDQLSMTIPKTKDGYDLKLLGHALHEIKQEFPKSDTVIVLPAPEVRYEDVVLVLDAAREFKRNDSDGEPAPLFPVVVLSRMV